MPLAGLFTSSGGAVLGLHSLTTPDLPSAGIVNLPLELFEQLIRAVRRVATIVPLSELVDTHARNRPTRGMVAVTFDDGYASLLEARELLRAESIPITVFVTSGSSSGGATFWWDRVDDLIPRVTPARWEAFERELDLPNEFKLGQPQVYGPVRPLRQWILATFKGRWPQHLEAPLASLEQETAFRTPQRASTFAELEELGQVPGVDFGVHTLTHPVLPLLGPEEFTREVGDCYRELKARLPSTLPLLAIPFGLFDSRTADLARSAGMEASFTLANRTLTDYSPADALPRFGLTCREKPWKLGLRVMGIAERILGYRADNQRGYPDLPSATT